MPFSGADAAAVSIKSKAAKDCPDMVRTLPMTAPLKGQGNANCAAIGESDGLLLKLLKP